MVIALGALVLMGTSRQAEAVILDSDAVALDPAGRAVHATIEIDAPAMAHTRLIGGPTALGTSVAANIVFDDAEIPDEITAPAAHVFGLPGTQVLLPLDRCEQPDGSCIIGLTIEPVAVSTTDLVVGAGVAASRERSWWDCRAREYPAGSTVTLTLDD